METRVTEIAPDIYRCSTYLSGAGLVHNQFLIDAEEPLLFHAGLRALFGPVSAAVARVVPVAAYDERLDGERARQRGPRPPAGTGH